jgi:hypothetical protein
MAKLLRNNPNFAGSINDLQYPHNTCQQYATTSARALASGLELKRLVGNRNGDMEELFANRIHQLMHYRSHTVDDWAF